MNECLFSVDINECLLNNHDCHADAECNNTIGSYSCSCKSGYIGHGYTCAGMYLWFFIIFYRSSMKGTEFYLPY